MRYQKFSKCFVSGSETEYGVKPGTMCKNSGCTTISQSCYFSNNITRSFNVKVIAGKRKAVIDHFTVVAKLSDL